MIASLDVARRVRSRYTLTVRCCIRLTATGGIFMGNFRYGFRMLMRNPVFAITAILCAGLGTGATTAIFSVVNAVLLRPLPYAHSDRLVRVFSEFPRQVSSASQGGFKHFWISPPEFFDLKRDTH